MEIREAIEDKKFFFTDWEGPWITTDFALEISGRILQNRDFFERLSQYDDYLYFVERKEGYNAGDTLKLLAPFIVASGIKSRDLKKLAGEVASFVPDAKRAMDVLQEKFTPIIISTSYVQYLEVTARKIGVKVEGNLYGTEFDVERFATLLGENERRKTENLIENISKMPEIRIDIMNRRLISGFETVKFLNNIFWGDNPLSKKIQKISGEIKVVGGRRKLEVVRKYYPENPIAIGDSVSDYEMLGWVRDRGLAVSFNGNEYSLMQSNLAIISDSAYSEAAVVEAFLLQGMEGVKKLTDSKNSGNWDKVREIVDERIAEGLMNSRTSFYWVGGDAKECVDYRAILAESLEMREVLRGDAGKLG